MKALSASPILNPLRRLLAFVVVLPVSIFPSPMRPRLSSMSGPRPPLQGLRKWAAWVRWSLWYPVDWLLYEDYYAELTKKMVAPPRLTLAAGYPPPSLRWMCKILTAPTVPDDRLL